MPLTISDDDLRAMGMTDQEARVEIACRLFDAGKLSPGHSARIAGLEPDVWEAELRKRGIPRFRYTQEMFELDVRALDMARERETTGT